MKAGLLAILAAGGLCGSAPGATPTVGIEGRLEVALPVAGLRARPPARMDPVTVRIAGSKPEAGATIYDVRYIGLVPGQYDLRPYLLQADGSAVTGLAPLPVEVNGVLPDEKKGMLIAIPNDAVATVGGYPRVLLGLGCVWLLMAIPVFRRRRAKATAPSQAGPVKLTLPERLRAMVARAAAGELDGSGKAELERLVLSHWSGELKLEALPPAEAMKQIRAHPEAAVLLKTLEDWLHRRPGTRVPALDSLLAAYGQPQEAAAP